MNNILFGDILVIYLPNIFCDILPSVFFHIDPDNLHFLMVSLIFQPLSLIYWRVTSNHPIYLSWLVVWNIFYVPIYWEVHFIPTDFHSIIFQRGGEKPPTRILLTIINHHHNH